MSEYEPVEIPHQYQKRTIATQAKWTRDELIPYVIKRWEDLDIPRGKKVKDSIVTTNVITMQTIHVEESSRALVPQAEKLKSDLEEQGY